VCVLIDANAAQHLHNNSEHGKLVKEWIEARPGRLASGGRNLTELMKVGSMQRWLASLARAGRLNRIPDAAVDAEEQRLTRLGACQSDDPHMIALARKSGGRILFSHDHALHQDFGDRSLIDGPRGCVYQRADHRHLLDERNCCAAPL
jgi:hypothetical protein